MTASPALLHKTESFCWNSKSLKVELSLALYVVCKNRNSCMNKNAIFKLAGLHQVTFLLLCQQRLVRWPSLKKQILNIWLKQYSISSRVSVTVTLKYGLSWLTGVEFISREVGVHLSFLSDLQVVFQCSGTRPYWCWPPWVGQLVTLWPWSPTITLCKWTKPASASPVALYIHLYECVHATQKKHPVWWDIRASSYFIPLNEVKKTNK